MSKVIETVSENVSLVVINLGRAKRWDQNHNQNDT
jgi:hypothetical protein